MIFFSISTGLWILKTIFNANHLVTQKSQKQITRGATINKSIKLTREIVLRGKLNLKGFHTKKVIQIESWLKFNFEDVLQHI